MTQQRMPETTHAGPWVPPHEHAGQKSFIATWLLSLLLGGLGIDRFYLGKIGTGILKLITFGGLGIWTLIDLILTLSGAQRDKQGIPLVGYQQHRKMAWIVTGVIVILGMLIGAFSPKSMPSTQIADPAPSAEAAAIEEPVKEAAAEEEPTDEAPIADESVAEEPAEREPSEAPVEAPVEEAPAAAEEEPEVPAEYQSALTSAETYSDMMHMSKKGIFDQLTSEYGGQFTDEAAQYAIDNIDADWNNNALESARTYQDEMAMSPAAIHDQLTSEYGGQFTASEADYAIEHLND